MCVCVLFILFLLHILFLYAAVTFLFNGTVFGDSISMYVLNTLSYRLYCNIDYSSADYSTTTVDRSTSEQLLLTETKWVARFTTYITKDQQQCSVRTIYILIITYTTDIDQLVIHK